ncbi:hypothetical protein ENSA5_61840 [Enhygromyxa salina]|uniref:Uncharacterized protein n=1 Tax=Enhygromyxa salina TaxID=215803 RepID=A0A2S9XDA6_9BACT|nr:hypothetical protein [Enhygromyxa salina]PRP90750.1 hypothetical protein ENSA5_61840 [Enhygromyxa salina]
MKLSKIFTTSLVALCLSLPIAACDGDDEGDADTTADTNNDSTSGEDTNGEDTSDEETGPSEDIDCSVYCVGYLMVCVESGMSMEFPNNDECSAACEMWDQDGTNCRYQQVIDGNCDQAGNMGDAC